MRETCRGIKQKKQAIEKSDFLYHLAGSSHQNINTIFIDAAIAPAAAVSCKQEWESTKQKKKGGEGEERRER